MRVVSERKHDHLVRLELLPCGVCGCYTDALPHKKKLAMIQDIVGVPWP